MEARGIRDQIVVATKYTTNYKRGANIAQKINYAGNNLKSLHISVEESPKRLRTDYIDILHLHWWDWDTSVEEVMNGLHYLVAARKVLHLKANQYARMAGKTPFVMYQGSWSIMQRDFERDMLPMARSEGLALAPFRVLAGGMIRTDGKEERRKGSGGDGRTISRPDWLRMEAERKVCKALEEVAAQVGAANIQAVAIAYVMQKAPYVFPIVGGRKVEQLEDNMKALDIKLSDEQVKFLEGVLSFDLGFPHSMVGNGTAHSLTMLNAGHIDKWPRPQAIRPEYALVDSESETGG
ncbi:NADP-dependent oxidoreductase domain-containing protein [Epithele typhae]|uniref:NADP-dependent oxidoreductase domain-containing protein n=1 Tax=Epithele typhae TaxID=378194 RepID=UPI002008A73B|nr:NADP-dependent oxidoreductase domain-containing protein [Epithele typhae]KAH9927974.1 NADP-dependent oxidoreductase domain-containing protein [Epithele typhae]